MMILNSHIRYIFSNMAQSGISQGIILPCFNHTKCFQDLSWEPKGTPPMPPLPRNKALLRAYSPSVSLNKAFLGPYFLGGWHWWGTLRFPSSTVRFQWQHIQGPEKKSILSPAITSVKIWFCLMDGPSKLVEENS